MQVHQWARGTLGVIGAATLAVLIAHAAPASAANAVQYDFATWGETDNAWYYPSNRFHITVHTVDYNATNTPATLTVVFDPAIKGAVPVTPGVFCDRKYTPNGQLFPGTWLTCNLQSVHGQDIRFYAVAPDQNGNYGITSILTKRGPQGPDADDSDNSSTFYLRVLTPG